MNDNSKQREYEKILSILFCFYSFYLPFLAVEGEKLSSEDLAKKIGKLTDEGKDITFIIGSSCGLSDRVKNASDYKLSFSDMTFPHQLMRVIFLEQLYRAFTILNNISYHK